MQQTTLPTTSSSDQKPPDHDNATQDATSGDGSTASGGGQPAPSFDEDDITVHEPAGLEAWQARRDRTAPGYSIFVVTVETARTLTDQYRGFKIRRRTVLPDDSDCYLTAGVRFEHPTPSEPQLALRVADWACSVLAVPHGPLLRPFGADHLAVFAPRRLGAVTADSGQALARVARTVADLSEPSLPSDDQFRSLVETLRELRAATHRDGELATDRQAIERTIRARCGFTTRYGSDVPDPHIEYADESLDALAARLDALEDELAANEQREREVREELRALRAERKQQLFDRLFAPHLAASRDAIATEPGVGP